jgi:pheromone shutdown-related protein TraB
MPDNIRVIEPKGRKIILVGTAHVSPESIGEVRRIIEEEGPDRVCVEIDQGRYSSMVSRKSWESLDIMKVLREGKGFLLLANLVLASFQRRMGASLAVAPGAEMRAAVEAAEAAGIPFSFCDREIQVTLRRAWARSNLWNKSKLLVTLFSSAFDREAIPAAEIEALKERSALDDMMGELAKYLPSVKEVVIDERDRYLAAKIMGSEGAKVVAVVGAGHVPGIEALVGRMDRGEIGVDVSDIDSVPKKSKLAGLAGLAVPALIIALILVGFAKSGATMSLGLLWKWLFIHGVAAAAGAALAFGHPLAILAAFVGSPVVMLKPFVSIGLVAAYVEAVVRKPQVADFQNLNEDVQSLRGFYRNKITRILLVFFLASIGGAVGNFIAIGMIGSKVF